MAEANPESQQKPNPKVRPQPNQPANRPRSAGRSGEGDRRERRSATRRLRALQGTRLRRRAHPPADRAGLLQRDGLPPGSQTASGLEAPPGLVPGRVGVPWLSRLSRLSRPLPCLPGRRAAGGPRGARAEFRRRYAAPLAAHGPRERLLHCGRLRAGPGAVPPTLTDPDPDPSPKPNPSPKPSPRLNSDPGPNPNPTLTLNPRTLNPEPDPNSAP